MFQGQARASGGRGQVPFDRAHPSTHGFDGKGPAHIGFGGHFLYRAPAHAFAFFPVGERIVLPMGQVFRGGVEPFAQQFCLCQVVPDRVRVCGDMDGFLDACF